MVNLEQNKESINSVDLINKELNDLKKEVELGKFGESLELMKGNKEFVDGVLEKVNVLRNSELELKDASKYRNQLAEYAEKLSNYSQSMEENIGGIESTIKFGKPDKKKINQYLEDTNTFANDARDIEGKLQGMEENIKILKENQDLKDEINQKDKEEQKRKEEEKKRKEAERKRKEEKARNNFWGIGGPTSPERERDTEFHIEFAQKSMNKFMNSKESIGSMYIHPYHFEAVNWGMNRKPDVLEVIDKIKHLRKDIRRDIDQYLTSNPADVKGLQKYLNECIGKYDDFGPMINRRVLKSLTEDKSMPLVYRPGKKPEFQIREDGKFGPQTFAVILSFEKEYRYH